MHIMAIVKLEHKLNSPYLLITVVLLITFAQSIIPSPVPRQKFQQYAGFCFGQLESYTCADVQLFCTLRSTSASGSEGEPSKTLSCRRVHEPRVGFSGFLSRNPHRTS
jgi:hypothetical protein